MEIGVDQLDNGAKHVRLSGRLDAAGTEQIEAQFISQVTSERVAVLVDLVEVDLIASMGIRMLITGAKGVTSKHGKFALVGPQPLVAQSLDLAGVGATIPIYPDLDAAIAGM